MNFMILLFYFTNKIRQEYSMNTILAVFTIVFSLFVGIAFLVSILVVLFRFLEYLFGLVFGKPFFVYFHPFPKKISHESLHFLNTKFPFYSNLDEKKQVYFEHRIASFINEYEFVSRENFVITEEVKVYIASTYIMLSFGMRDYLCDVFDKIIIFPSVYFSNVTKQYHKGEFNPNAKAVVFSWEDFQQGFDFSSDNLNLGIHEFAHVLHHQGLKRNDNGSVLFSRMYTIINEDVSNAVFRDQLIQSNYFRAYAFTNRFEFLAVILEHYFETPLEFKIHFPDLFDKVSLMLNRRD
jgi:Mlc titration factor MtfA (ptsG expression regulator)